MAFKRSFINNFGIYANFSSINSRIVFCIVISAANYQDASDTCKRYSSCGGTSGADTRKRSARGRLLMPVAHPGAGSDEEPGSAEERAEAARKGDSDNELDDIGPQLITKGKMLKQPKEPQPSQKGRNEDEYDFTTTYHTSVVKDNTDYTKMRLSAPQPSKNPLTVKVSTPSTSGYNKGKVMSRPIPNGNSTAPPNGNSSAPGSSNVQLPAATGAGFVSSLSDSDDELRQCSDDDGTLNRKEDEKRREKRAKTRKSNESSDDELGWPPKEKKRRRRQPQGQ
jgi:hypothetical protein